VSLNNVDKKTLYVGVPLLWRLCKSWPCHFNIYIMVCWMLFKKQWCMFFNYIYL